MQGARKFAAVLVASAALAGTAPNAAAESVNTKEPGISPPGANNFGCQPSREKPFPIVLLHGTRANMAINWLYMSPMLASRGYCVFAIDLVEGGEASMHQSAARLKRFVSKVRMATRARRVSIVGHSQGGLVARQYVKFLGGKHTVDDVVSLASPHQGYTSAPEFEDVDAMYNEGCAACYEMYGTHEFMRNLNKGDMSPGRIAWTNIQTKYDEVVIPYDAAFMDPDERVANILLQDACPNHVVDHLLLAGDPLVLEWIEDALRRRGTADPDRRVKCLP